MQFEIREADFGDPVHATGIVDLLNSFAADPAGGAKPLSADVRERLRWSAALILLPDCESGAEHADPMPPPGARFGRRHCLRGSSGSSLDGLWPGRRYHEC